MKNLKLKTLLLLVSSIGFSLIKYETAHADSYDSQDTSAFLNPKMRMNLQMEGSGFSKAHKLVFIRKDGPGSLYYDYTIRKYVWIQTESTSTAVINTIIQGLAGSVGGDHFVIEKK